jgi:hypothetical protein
LAYFYDIFSLFDKNVVILQPISEISIERDESIQ